jgi:hypothetical protein
MSSPAGAANAIEGIMDARKGTSFFIIVPWGHYSLSHYNVAMRLRNVAMLLNPSPCLIPMAHDMMHRFAVRVPVTLARFLGRKRLERVLSSQRQETQCRKSFPKAA